MHNQPNAKTRGQKPRGSCLCRLFKYFLFLSLCFALAVVSAFYYFPAYIDPIVFNLPKLTALQGKLAPNDKLNESSIVYENMLQGPESLVYFGGAIYASDVRGAIMRIKDDKVEVFAKLGPKDCTSMEQCGRPLGMRLDPFNARLIVADAYLGLFAVTLTEAPQVKKLFPTPDFNPAMQVTFFNDVDIISDGVFVVTESSTTMPLSKLSDIVLEGKPTGQILRVDTNKKQYSVIAKKVAMPNGIQMTKDNSSILVAECLRHQILSIPLKPNKKLVVFDNIPGMPDNIRPSPRGGYWVALASVATVEEPSFYYWSRDWPQTRLALHKLVPPSVITSPNLMPNRGIVVRINENGEILESLQGYQVQGASVISEVLELADKTVYLGSYSSPFLRKLKL